MENDIAFDSKDVNYLRNIGKTLTHFPHLLTIANKIEAHLQKISNDVVKEEKPDTWVSFLYYKHKAFKNINTESLGLITAKDRVEALNKATKMCLENFQDILNDENLKNNIETYEIRVRPYVSKDANHQKDN